MEEKLCPNCNERKRAPLFYPNTITPDGLSENCRSCCKARRPTMHPQLYLALFHLIRRCRQNFLDSRHADMRTANWQTRTPSGIRWWWQSVVLVVLSSLRRGQTMEQSLCLHQLTATPRCTGSYPT